MADEEQTQTTESTETTESTRTIDSGTEVPATEVPEQVEAKQENDSETTTTDTKSADAVEFEPFNLPDGVTVAEEDLAVFNDIARELDIGQEGGQKLVDLALSVQENTLGLFQEQQAADQQAEVDGWRSELQSHETLGGDNMKATEQNMNAFVNSEFMNDEAFEVLNSRGLFAHPGVAQMAAMIGKLMSEDSPGILGGSAGDGKSKSQKMFGNSTPN